MFKVTGSEKNFPSSLHECEIRLYYLDMEHNMGHNLVYVCVFKILNPDHTHNALCECMLLGLR